MDSKNNKKSCCQKTMVYFKAACSVIGLVVLSTVLWITGCEILWYGTLWIEDIYRLKNRFYVYELTGLVLFLGLGLVTIIISASLVLFGIPFTLVHVDHFFNRQKMNISNNSSTNTNEQNSKQALQWTISIFIFIFIGLAIGAVGCEVMQWSGMKLKALFNDDNELDQISFYLKQWSFLTIMFAGLLVFFIGFLLAPFMLAFAGVVSFDKKKNSYRLRRPRRRRRCDRSFDSVMKV